MTQKVKLSFHLDVDAAEKAEEILSSLGLPLSDAVNLFMHQINIKNGLPFKIRQSREKAKTETQKPVKEGPGGRLFKSPEEMWAGLPAAEVPNPERAEPINLVHEGLV